MEINKIEKLNSNFDMCESRIIYEIRVNNNVDLNVNIRFKKPDSIKDMFKFVEYYIFERGNYSELKPIFDNMFEIDVRVINIVQHESKYDDDIDIDNFKLMFSNFEVLSILEQNNVIEN